VVKKRINNRELYCEVIISKERGIISPRLLEMLLMIGDNLITKFHFTNYDWRLDCLQYGYSRVLENWMQFNEIIYSNPFAYYTEIYKRAFAFQYNQLKNDHVRLDALEYINI
jgi:hypothetical protein